jgi:flagellar motor switch protein FliN/FliY
MTLGGAALPPLHLCLTPALRDAIQAGVARAGPKAVAAPGTLDLLLEVELPVSVSFGRAQLPLKDVLKLTAGSIVELNRTVSEPVEVIVNDCVIARGEVVVVDGNYGVRIQEITSREKRLKTLQ